jgi:hypothetical protein
MSKLVLPNISPLWYQVPAWKAFSSGIRRRIVSFPRRHGKDFLDGTTAAWEAIHRRGTYYYVFPTRKWGERAVWETMAEINGVSKPIIDWWFPDEIAKKFKSDLRVELINGSKFFMGGTDNLDFVGQGGQGYTMSEFSLHKDAVTSLLAPIIRQSQAYIHLNGTLRGKNNPLYQILQKTSGNPEWFSTWLKPQDTKLYCWVSDEMKINEDIYALIGQIDPKTGQLYKNCQGVPYYNVQEDIDSGLMSYAYARQEYLNDVVSHVVGGYYGYELDACEKRRGFRDIDPFDDIVYTFWDLGGKNEDNDSTCVLFAQIDMQSKRYKIVDYYEARGGERKDHWQVVLNKNYNYGGHFFPHDGKRTSNNWDGESAAESAMRHIGIDIRFIPKTQNIMNDIEITRRGFVHTEFANNRDVGVLIEHLGNYHEKETTGKPCHQNNCRECNGASHAADAFRYMHMAIYLKLVEPYLLGTVAHDGWWNNHQEPDLGYDDFIV